MPSLFLFFMNTDVDDGDEKVWPHASSTVPCSSSKSSSGATNRGAVSLLLVVLVLVLESRLINVVGRRLLIIELAREVRDAGAVGGFARDIFFLLG